jgi:drug/metabolite transporter (DMT)-like permease
MPTYLSILPEAFMKSMIIIFFIMTFIAPLLSILVLYNLKIITQFEISNRKERIIPYIVTGVFYLATYLIFSFFPYKLPPAIISVILISTVSVFFTLILNFIFKISAHSMGIGSVTGLLVIFYSIFQSGQSIHLAVLFLLAGIIAFARLKENSHTPFQVYAGYISGFIIGLGSYFIY